MEPGAIARFQYGVRAKNVVSATLLTALLAACASATPRMPVIPPLHGQEIPDVVEVDLLRMSPAMTAFAETYAKPSSAGKAWGLAYAALDPYLLDFEYDPMVDLPADEAFQRRRGNCLTFSSLFVALARSVGLDAWYQEVRVPPRWNAVNETLLVSKHVNAVVSEWGARYVIDVSRRRASRDDVTRRMSDQEAEAQYYNNLGADALVADNLALAYAYFRRALQSAPRTAYVWSNLGVVFRRNDQASEAMLAYQAALESDPDEAVALNNLYNLYLDHDMPEAARAMASRVERNRRNNPYYLHHLAEIANDEHRFGDAIDLLERAIDLDDEEYRFHYTMAQSQFYAGHYDVVRASLDRARQLAGNALPEGRPTWPDGG